MLKKNYFMICASLAFILLYPVIVHTVFSIISDLIQLLVQQPTLWPVGYELIHILFNLKYFNPLGILRTHCGLFELHKFCCLALFIYLFIFSGNHTHMHKYTGALLSPELAKEGNGAPLKMYRAHKSQSSNHKP